MTVAVVASMILAGLVLVGTKANQRNAVSFNNGDYFRYLVSGNVNATPVQGNATIELHEWGYNSMSSGYRLPQSVMGKYQTYDGIGGWVGNHRINTTWGERSVQMYLKIDDFKIIITDVGIDSSVIYRTTCMTANGTVQSILTATNNSGMQSADTRLSDDTARGLMDVTDGGTIYGFPATGGFTAYGSVEVKEGQSLHYNLTDSGAYLFFFSVQDLFDTSNDGRAHYQQALSLALNQTGLLNVPVPAGCYWYCIVISSASGGIFLPYWSTDKVS